MPTEIRRVAINHVAFRSPANHVAEIGADKFPITRLHRFADVINLVDDFGHVSLGETFWFVAVRRVEATFAVEANDAIEARAIEKQKIPRTSLLIEP